MMSQLHISNGRLRQFTSAHSSGLEAQFGFSPPGDVKATLKSEDTGKQQHCYSSYEPHPQQIHNPQPTANTITTTELARFLAKSQLVTEVLTKFDDKPENYLSWKSTFQNIIAELGLTVSEEVSLLIKWLGPESAEYTRRIKGVNSRQPSVGLKIIWS